MKIGFIKYSVVVFWMVASTSFVFASFIIPTVKNKQGDLIHATSEGAVVLETAAERAAKKADFAAPGGASFGSPFETKVVLSFKATTDVPGVTQAQQELPFLPEYIRRAYIFALSAAGIIAVFQFVRAGFKWMFSEVITSKQDALDELKQTTYGLVLLLASVLILNTLGILNQTSTADQEFSRLAQKTGVNATAWRTARDRFTTSPTTVNRATMLSAAYEWGTTELTLVQNRIKSLESSGDTKTLKDWNNREEEVAAELEKVLNELIPICAKEIPETEKRIKNLESETGRRSLEFNQELANQREMLIKLKSACK